jgi:hypothetical protein
MAPFRNSFLRIDMEVSLSHVVVHPVQLAVFNVERVAAFDATMSEQDALCTALWNTMNNTLGAPSFARSGIGQAGDDLSTVRSMTPGNAVPGSYSTSDMIILFNFRY